LAQTWGNLMSLPEGKGHPPTTSNKKLQIAQNGGKVTLTQKKGLRKVRLPPGTALYRGGEKNWGKKKKWFVLFYTNPKRARNKELNHMPLLTKGRNRSQPDNGGTRQGANQKKPPIVNV